LGHAAGFSASSQSGFSAVVSVRKPGTPACKSQIDMWTTGKKGEIFYSFELKCGNNRPTGILAEAFYYARMLSYAQQNIVRVSSTAKGLQAVRRARVIAIILTGPSFHPLVYSTVRGERDSPLSLFNDALRGNHMGFLILRYERGAEEFRWCVDDMWPTTHGTV
jgi:hypothetical protein